VITASQTKKLPDQVLDWFCSETGQILLSSERQAFDRLAEQVFGFQLIQLGYLEDTTPMLVNSKVKHQTVITLEEHQGWHNYFPASFEKLPIMTDSIDAVVLPHTLDFCVDPQKVLLEVERVLIPEGKLLISGFNPFSLWGMTRAIKTKRRKVPYNGHFVSYTRLHDWFSLLGFDVEQTEVILFRPPLQNSKVMQKLMFMEKLGMRLWPGFGAVYMIKAVKRVSTLTPITPIWNRRPRILSHIVEPTTRGVNRGKSG
jgi:SAM-dependent methyltransferase